MSWERYHLQHPVRVTSAGIVYAAKDSLNELVYLCDLEAARDTDCWPDLARRLKLAAMLQDPFALAVRELGLEAEPPFVVVERPDGMSLAEDFAEVLPLPIQQTLELSRDVANVLAAAHRLGLVHSRLSPHSLLRSSSGSLKLDFTGLAATTAIGIHVAELDCRPPEPIIPGQSDPAGDLFAFGMVIAWLLSGKKSREELLGMKWRGSETKPGVTLSPVEFAMHRELHRLAGELCRIDPSDRPNAQSVADAFNAMLASTDLVVDLQATQAGVAQPDPSVALRNGGPPERLGRFRLLEKLGEGGMGAVYRAEDVTDGCIVAVKLLKPELARHPASLRRFEKEARMLAAVRNPYVANLLEVNEQDGIHFLAMEFVAGRSLREELDAKGRLDETTSMRVAADVCRALDEAHVAGIVHRDIKPENILLAETPATLEGESPTLCVKLTDFGLARSIEQSESMNLTRDNLIGTPLYMAPEQGHGGQAIDARTDVYSIGATLFHLLAGRPPYLAETPMAVLLMHANEPLPRLAAFNPAVSDGAIRLIDRAMAKRPAERFANAADMLREIERLQRGEPSSLAIHPLLPPDHPTRIRELLFRWELNATPEQLWPHVSNTERLNRAIGLPAVRFTDQRDGRRMRRFASAKKIGLVAAWEEHPFEWIEGRRFGVLRVMSRGPFKWIASIVELAPRSGGGTILTHTFRLVPRGWLGKLVATIELGGRTRRALDRVYRRIDAIISDSGSRYSDQFEDVPRLSGTRLRRLEQALIRLESRGVAPAIGEGLGRFLTEAADQAVARIRPLNLAARMGMDPDRFVDACLLAASEGLLVLMWDILCPVCRIPAQFHDSLKMIQEHGHCEACNLDFELDFANSVELIFRVHPEIRQSELGTYCIGGPAHSPHVAAQVRVASGERLDLALALAEGAYRLRGPQLPYAIDFRVAAGARIHRWELALSRRPANDFTTSLREGDQTFVLTNDSDQELLVRIERTAPRSDALTAGRAAALPLFRELFPHERLAPGMLVGVSQVTLLVTDLMGVGNLYRDQGDAKAFAIIHEALVLTDEEVKRNGGAVVKSLGAGLVAAFNEPVSALRAARKIVIILANSTVTQSVPSRCGIHRGPAMTATINDRLDYFGATVNLALALPTFAGAGEVIVSRAVAADARIVEFLVGKGFRDEVVEIAVPDCGERCAHRLTARLQ